MLNPDRTAPPPDRLETIAALRTAVEDVMTISGYTYDQDGTVHLRGRLKVPVDKVYRTLRERVERVGYTPFLKEQEDMPGSGAYELTAVRGVTQRLKLDSRVNLWLYIATFASVIITGTQFGAVNNGFDIGSGLMFGLTVMAILTAHEMGHYVIGKMRGAPVSLPYFIPLPLVGMFGTMGAVIVQREPFEDRRTLLEVGIAGPLAGFIVALPLLILGLMLSKVQPVASGGQMISFGDSLLTQTLGFMRFGTLLPGTDIIAHPILIGAWFGMLVTGINLVPAGQLDGGHIAYAILGPFAKYLSYAMIAVFGALALLVSDSWLIWAIMLLIFGRSHPPSLNQAVKLEPLHFALAIIAVLVLVLVFVPNPLSVT
ncbi:MAG TPA: site-2 protease family protein [Anaerolineae bacterium]